MPVSVKGISDMFSMDVFTNKGFYCGKISDMEFDLSRYKIKSIVVDAARNSTLGKIVGGKKGVVVPYSMVQAVGDIVVIKHINEVSMPEEMGSEDAMMEAETPTPTRRMGR